MGMNWGGFGGFATGFASGINMGQAIKQAFKEDAINKVREQGIAEARAAREAAVNGAVQETGGADPAKAPPQGQTGEVAPDNAVAQTAAVRQPQTMTVTPTPAAAMPQDAPPVNPAAAGIPGAPGTGDISTASPDQPAPAPIEIPEKVIAAPAAQVPASGAAPAAVDGIATERGKFKVGDRSFNTRTEALAHADKTAPPMMDFIAKTMVPRMQEALVEQGDIEKAEAWGKWAEDRKSKAHMKTWAKAYGAAQRGDYEGAADAVFELYKHYDDGVTPVSKEVVKDKAGNVTGFNVKLRNDDTGEVRSQFVDPKSLVSMGLSALSPPAMFEQAYKRQSEADALAAKARIDEQNDNRTLKREIIKQEYIEDRADKRAEVTFRRDAEKDKRQHGYKLEELATAEELRTVGIVAGEKAKVQAKIEMLKDGGLSPEAIRELLPHMVGGDGYKKATSPEETRRLLMTEHVKDPLFNNKPDAEKRKIIDQEMGVIYSQPTATPKSAAPATPSGGMPFGSKAPAGIKDGAYKDPKTGQPFRVQGGVIVPFK